MKKLLSLAALTAVLTIPVAQAASSATLSMRCAKPILNAAAADKHSNTQYTVSCISADEGALAPVVRYSGELRAEGGAPYPVRASYHVDARQAYAQALNIPKDGAIFTGSLRAEVSSITKLSALLEEKTHWDPESATLSVEESAGLWRVVSVRFDDISGDPYVLDAGMASKPVQQGQSRADLIFSRTYSRFAAKEHARMPQVQALVMVKDGVLALEVEATRALNAAALTHRMAYMDANPSDVSRAWAVGAMAQFMGLDQEVGYVLRQVAAHNPHLLDEFNADLQKITPYSLPKN